MALGAANLLGLLVPRLGGLVDIRWLNLGDEEGSSEGASGLALMEQFVQVGVNQTSVLSINLRHGDGVGRVIVREFCSVLLVILSDLGQPLGDLGVGNEGSDVRVVAESEHVLAGGGLIPGSGSDADSCANREVGELQLESNCVPSAASSVSESQFVCVFIELVDVGNLGVDIEVTLGSLDLVEGTGFVGWDGIVVAEVLRGPFAEVGKNSLLVLLKG